MKTPAERKRDERARYKAQGLVLYSRWVKPVIISKLDKLIKNNKYHSQTTTPHLK